MSINQWVEKLQDRIWEDSTTDSEKLLSVLIEIFQKIPLDDAETLLNQRDVFFVLPIVSTVKELYFNFDESDLENGGSGSKIQWLVMLRSDLVDDDRDNFVYTVVHELAHVLLEHNAAKTESGPQNEIEADKLVIKWGFEKELKASPDNYLYGMGEYQKEVREMYEKDKGTKEK